MPDGRVRGAPAREQMEGASLEGVLDDPVAFGLASERTRERAGADPP